MKILFVAINSKFSHTSLAVRYLRAYAKKQGISASIQEYTINQDTGRIVADLYREKADVYGFSTYIFNVEAVLAVTADLKKLLPDTVFFCGGPEVSYGHEAFLRENTQIDYVLRGEGEETVSEFLLSLAQKSREALPPVPGTAFLQNGTLVEGPGRAPICNLDEIPFPYDANDLLHIKEKIIYYESSRGCPFRCSYCMSSLEKQVRSFSLERVFSDLQFFLDHRVRLVKFVDRTFNYDTNRAKSIWRFLKEHDNGHTGFHFEIAVWLLDEETLAFLQTVRKGLFQFEIGIQSTNPETLAAINRRQNVALLAPVFEKLASSPVHVHADLIAGLPYETLESFGKSFNDAMALRPDVLQLGFLKILKGTAISGQEEHGYLSSRRPPYEVLKNRYIRYDDIVFLKKIEELHDRYYNSGMCKTTVCRCSKALKGDFFAFYAGFVNFLSHTAFFEVLHQSSELFETLYRYMEKDFSAMPELRECLAFDLYSYGKVHNPPEWLSLLPDKDAFHDYLSHEEDLLRQLPSALARTVRKEGLRKWIRRMDIVTFHDPALQTVLFVYQGETLVVKLTKRKGNILRDNNG